MAMGQKLMRAVRVFEFGGPEVLKLQSNVAVPIPKGHQVGTVTHCKQCLPRVGAHIYRDADEDIGLSVCILTEQHIC